MRREIITWSIVAALIVAAFTGTVLILNSSLYSASGFVRGYLDALERKDAEGALELAGFTDSTDASAELLTRDAMGELSGIRLISDESDASGLHHVVYAWTADGVAGQSTFDVRRTGTLLAFFSTWSFETSPIATIELNVQHDDRFTANGLDLVTPADNGPAAYLAFTPSTSQFTHDTEFLTATPEVVTVTAPGSVMGGTLDIQANEKFVAAAQVAVNRALDECTTQKVLLPTGCPFGQEISNRIVTDPVWSMITYPVVAVDPGAQLGQWRMPPAAATAHLVVDVKSIFDGSVSTLDEDVPFTVGYTISLLPDGEIVVSATF